MSNHRDRLAKCILEETLESIGLPRREFEIDPGYLPRADCCVLPVTLPPLLLPCVPLAVGVLVGRALGCFHRRA